MPIKIVTMLIQLLILSTVVMANIDVIASFDYSIPIENDINDNDDTTYAKVNHENEIVFLQIVNQSSIPQAISHLLYLNELRIIKTNNFDIAHFPKTIRYLFISDIHIPPNFNFINTLVNLEVLTIEYTDLEYLSYIGNLHRLQFLRLNNNNLNSLPISIRRLGALEQLDVTNNPKLRSLDPINGHHKLELVTASSCSIESLPRQLSQLYILSLNNNSLKSLDNIETLGRNVKGEMVFTFENNQIEIIPQQIIQVQNLYTLNLRRNKIENIQIKYLCQLKNLKNLFISRNPQGETEQPYSNQMLKKCLPDITIH